MRLPNILDSMITCTYALAAAVLGLVLVRVAGLEPGVGLAAGGLALLLSADIHASAKSKRANDRLEAEIRALRAEHEALKAETRNQISAVETEASVAGEERDRALMSEMRTLEDLIRKLSDSGPAAAASALQARQSNGDTLEAVRGALEDNRVDLYLQPIVSLPQRRLRYYETFTRMRNVDGGVIMPGEFLNVARQAGLLTAIDNLLLFRCVQVVRRLAQKERRVGVFCNVSMDSLADPDFFPQFMDFMRRNHDLADSLVFEIGQEAFETRSLEAARSIARLADFGFRFSIDHVQDLDADFAEMQRAGVAFFKAPGRLMVETLSRGGSIAGVSAEDYAANLARYGIELIAEKIEDEPTVVEILDFDVALGQGHLFGQPRPIKEAAMSDPAGSAVTLPPARAAAG